MSQKKLKALSPDDRHKEWMRIAERIHDEQLSQGSRDRNFRLIRAVFANNNALAAQGAFLFNWMAWNYFDSSLMLIRRELDTQNNTENLKNLLKDIIKHPEVLTRSRYIAQWNPTDPIVKDIANESFNSFVPKKDPTVPENDFIDPATVQSDLNKVIAAADGLRVYAEQTRAHRTPNDELTYHNFTFKELSLAISSIREIAGKYYSLLKQTSIATWEPIPQYNQFAPFMTPWVIAKDAVEKYIQNEICCN